MVSHAYTRHFRMLHLRYSYVKFRPASLPFPSFPFLSLLCLQQLFPFLSFPWANLQPPLITYEKGAQTDDRLWEAVVQERVAQQIKVYVHFLFDDVERVFFFDYDHSRVAIPSYCNCCSCPLCVRHPRSLDICKHPDFGGDVWWG